MPTAASPQRFARRWRRSVAGTVIALALAAAGLRAGADETTSVVLRIIVVESLDDARRLREQLEQGESFVALAHRRSIDPTASAGGLIGRVQMSALRPELRRAVEGVEPGHLGPIVQVPTGFALVKVESAAGNAGPGPAVTTPGRAFAATGSVRYTTDLAGFGVALAALQHLEKPAGWQMDPQVICDLRKQSLAGARASLEADLASTASRRPVEQLQMHALAGQLQAYDGSLSRAIDSYRAAQRVARESVAEALGYTEEVIGVAHLHKAQMDNRVFSAPGDRCLLSTRPTAMAQTAEFNAAIERFTSYLAERPDELEVRWLLNLAHMGAGSYPDKVPPSQLIPPAALESAEDAGAFVDVAGKAGLDAFTPAGGVIVDDFDNDGRFEVVTSSIDSCEPMHFFRRDGKGLFVERGTQAGLARQLGGLNLTQADFDNDGALDILLLRGGWETAQRKSLLRNNGDGTFTDVTVASGLASPTSTQAAVWTDIDQDGFLDLFVGNEDGPAQLFVNRRNGTFEDVAAKAGVNRRAFSKGVAAGDYDNDGWPDLYVSNMGGRNFLYHNDRNGRFTERAQEASVEGPGQGFATWFFDYDNDGWQDLFVTSYFTSVDETARTYLKLPNNAGTLKLYRNLGGGRFSDVTGQTGLNKVFMPMGANYGDIDNDGFLDIYLGTGNPSYASLVPNVLLRNKEGKTFVDVTTSSRTGELHKGHGVAFADLDHDGDEEIVHQVGGATPNDAHMLRLFDNPGNANRWINLKLAGVKTNRSAIGARISVTPARTSGSGPLIHRGGGSGGSFGASPLQQHVGLGADVHSVDIYVFWPASGTRQRFLDIATNQTIEIREFAEGYTRLERPRLPFGGRTDASPR